MSKKGKPAAFLFSKGDRVRVKAGVRDPDFPDMPLGGWAGTVEEVEKGRPVSYLVRWDRRTLDAIHPVFRSRCERDGLEVERMLLAEEDLEPDAGGPAPIEQPTQIVTKPLDPKDQDDRLRAIFRLTHDDLLPEMDEESLRAFRDHLSVPGLSFRGGVFGRDGAILRQDAGRHRHRPARGRGIPRRALRPDLRRPRRKEARAVPPVRGRGEEGQPEPATAGRLFVLVLELAVSLGGLKGVGIGNGGVGRSGRLHWPRPQGIRIAPGRPCAPAAPGLAARLPRAFAGRWRAAPARG